MLSLDQGVTQSTVGGAYLPIRVLGVSIERLCEHTLSNGTQDP